VVEPAVAGAGEPVADLVAGGSIDGCGAGPGREPVPVSEPGDVTDVSEDAGGAGRADPEHAQQPGPGRGHPLT
jgi:hypothetical protein